MNFMMLARRRWNRRTVTTRAVAAACLVVCSVPTGAATADDWPTYRGNTARSGLSDEQIVAKLSPHWTFKPTHPPDVAWPRPAEERHRMAFDRAYFVTASGGLVYFGSSVDNTVRALDAATGKVRWSFHTQGPVRFAPTVWRGRVYVGSDDGHVYCLAARDGKLVWKHRPGPSDQKVCGNERMISLWPIRTDVIVDRGVAYFAAGVFPYEGIYICAVNATDGKPIWKNDTLGDHSHELTFGGITPQGYLLASKDILYVPAGRAMPVAFNRKTGKFMYVCDAGGKTGGTWALLSGGNLIAGVDHSGTPAKIAYDGRTGKRKGDAFAWFHGIDLVAGDKMSYTITEEGTYAIDRAHYAKMAREIRGNVAKTTRENRLLGADRKRLRAAVIEASKAKGKGKTREAIDKKREMIDKQIAGRAKRLRDLGEKAKQIRKRVYKWFSPGKDLCSLAVAGKVVFTGGKGTVAALDAESGKLIWSGKVRGNASGLAVAAGRLLVSTDSGTIHCFGPAGSTSPETVENKISDQPYPNDRLSNVYKAVAKRIIAESGVTKGYCLVLGCGQGRLAFELAKLTQLKIVGVEADATKVAQAREKLATAGMLGSRIVVEPWDLSSLPDYFANLIVSDETITSGKLSGSVEEVQRILRPAGGTICIAQAKNAPGGITPSREKQLVSFLKTAGNAEPVVLRSDGFIAKVVRGKLDGAGTWAHQYADTHNTACGDDVTVRAPLGLLWFGEPGPELMVERHARAASPVAADGRLFVQGGEVIFGVDAYNGTVLWKRAIPGAVRVRVDVDGGNMYLSAGGLYVAAGKKCHRLDPATGKTIRVYEIPSSAGNTQKRWGYVACGDNILYGSAATPLRHEYGASWKAVADSGKGTSYDKVSPQYAKAQRAGDHWRRITKFPVWGNQRSPKGALSRAIMTSSAVFALDPETGKQRWVYRGKEIPQITITIADGKIYLLETTVTEAQKAAALAEKKDYIRKGVYLVGDEAKLAPKTNDVRLLVVLDAATGRKLWDKPIELAGCGGDKLGAAYRDGLLCFFGHFSNHDGGLFRDNKLRWRRITTVDAKTGRTIWSKQLNYLRRPLIVGDEIIIEPRACDLRTGRIKMRAHPITGQSVPWEFLRPGHSCGITSGAPNMIFYRSYCSALYDMTRDSGLALFGGIRPGCWLNMIAANGLLSMPEASSGCTCSFPLRCSIALKPRRRNEVRPWTTFITHGSQTPVRRLCINLGAPGDRKDEAGAMWLSYPRPKTGYGVKLALHPPKQSDTAPFARDFRDAAITGTDRPWLFTSGYLGRVKWSLPLLDDLWSNGAGTYTLRLGFAAPEDDKPGQRTFDIKVQDRVVARGFDIVAAAGRTNRAVVKDFRGIRVSDRLAIELVPKVAKPTKSQAPIVNFIEVVREGTAAMAKAPKPAEPLSDARATKLLADARAKLKAKQLDEAMNLYHALFDGTTSMANRSAALKGIAAVASPESLSRIAVYCKNVSPILRDYDGTPAELRRGAIRAMVAIAGNVLGPDKAKAIRMLSYALAITRDMTVRQEVIDGLQKAGVRIDEEYAKQGFVTRWHVVGPFQWNTNSHTMDKLKVGEPNIDLNASYTYRTGKIGWRPYVCELPMVDLARLYGSLEAVAAYAYAEVVLDKDQDLRLNIGSNDDFKCWFNGNAVGRFDGGRAWKADQDAVKVRGKKGVNKILMKVANHGDNWGLSVKLTDLKGKPIRFKVK